MKKTLLTLTALTLLFGSCKKDDDNNSGGSTTNAMLNSGKWKITASTADIDYGSPIGVLPVNLYDAVPACQIDNFFTFNTSGSVTIDEGATKCNSGDPQQKTEGSWSLQNNDTKLSLVSGTTNIDADVLTLNNTTLIIRYITYINGPKATTTTTYTHY